MNYYRGVVLLGFLRLLGVANRGWAEEGVVQNGLQLQLVPLQQEFIVGQPMKVRLEIINQGEQPAKVLYTADDIQGDDFIIFGQDDYQAVYKGSGEYPERNLTLHLAPGSRQTLIKARDLNLEYSIRSPGRYTVQYVQKIWDHTSTQFPPSNRVEITVIKSTE